MSTEVRLWHVREGKLERLTETPFASEHVEKELENWIEQTPDILGDNLLIIARQLDLLGVGTLDLLAIDGTGRLVIIELKRDKTPREAVAQALHYASWLDTGNEDQIRLFAEEYLERPLEDAFEEHFGEPLPALVCQNHRIILVAPKLDPAAEAIVNYLAERHNVQINAVFFSYTKVGDAQVLARALLVPEKPERAGVEKKPTIAELIALAEEKKIRPLVERTRQMNDVWEEHAGNRYKRSFFYRTETPDGKPRMVFGINVGGGRANAPTGELDVWIPTEHLAAVTGIDNATIRKVLADDHKIYKSNLFDVVIRLKTTAEADALVARLKSWVKGQDESQAAAR